jgi:hypothetical protein
MKEVAKMLKKVILVFVSVLSMASLANAGITISVDGQANPGSITISPSDTRTIGIVNTVDADRQDFLMYLDFVADDSLYSLSGAALGAGAGDFPTTLLGPDSIAGPAKEYTINQAWAVGTDPVSGTVMTVNLHCDATGDITVQLWDDRVGYDAPVDQLVIHQVVPEPMTLALLGLGGLLLRRKTA